MIYRLRYCLVSYSLCKICTAIFIQLEDVQQAYTMDEIRFEEKYEDLLGRYQSERDTERKGYEVSWCNSCINNYFVYFRMKSMVKMVNKENYRKC